MQIAASIRAAENSDDAMETNVRSITLEDPAPSSPSPPIEASPFPAKRKMEECTGSPVAGQQAAGGQQPAVGHNCESCHFWEVKDPTRALEMLEVHMPRKPCFTRIRFFNRLSQKGGVL